MTRRRVFTRDLADTICERLAEGESLRTICESEGMPTERAVRDWALEDIEKSEDYEGFGSQYARAREIGYLKLADELIDIADDGSNDWMKRKKDGNTVEVPNQEVISRSRLRVDTRKWILSKMLPKVYGDKITTEHTGPDGGKIGVLITDATASVRGIVSTLTAERAAGDSRKAEVDPRSKTGPDSPAKD